MVNSTPRPHFTSGKAPVHILQETGWVSGPVWTGGKSRPHWDSILDSPARSSVIIPTELPGPQYYIKLLIIKSAKLEFKCDCRLFDSGPTKCEYEG